MESTFSNILAAWYKKFQRYKVGYKNGSYQLNNLFQSPQTMIDSFDQMPFTHHDPNKKLLASDSIFLKSKMYYCNPEDELWLMVSNLHFKKNLLMRNLYDDKLPLEYHFINIHIKATTIVNKSMVNGVVVKGNTWSLFKAGHSVTEYHFKNSEEKNITIFFTSRWLEKQKAANPLFGNSKLADFFDSPNTGVILDETQPIYEAIWDEMMLLAMQGVAQNQEAIRKIMRDVLHHFIKKLNLEVISENHFKLNDKDRKNIQRAEQFLNDHLFGDFPGIDKTARKVGISPTKLKNDFKSMHDTSLYQYFSARQMQVAQELLAQKKHTVKEIAGLLGYENPSKFSAVFKKTFDLSPSEI
ncbi:MAG: helix-turn-helix domain-containing protein [Fluviicola sp.]